MSLSEKDRALKDLRDRLQAFVGAVAEITDCSDDVDAINRADALLQAAREEAYKEGWNDREDDLISGVNRIAPEQPPQEGAGEPVAWRVKDFADGWFFYGKERGAEAMRAQVDGFLVQPLFTSPPTDPRTKALEEALDEATRWLLRYVEACGGKADASDYPGSPILLWCADRAEGDDTLNLAIERGYLTSGHDSDSDTSTIRLTDSGRRAVLALSPVQAVKGDEHG